MNEIRNRTMGCLYGQAIGNALGLCCEGQAKQEIATYLQFYDNHSGFWEDDDTNQMLCLLDELIAHRRIDPKSLAMRLLGFY